MQLNILWKNVDQHKICGEIDYTYMFSGPNCVNHSIIDHFVLNSKSMDAVCETGIIHCNDNFSNHSPIYCKLEVDKLDLSYESIEKPQKVCWDKATKMSKEYYKVTFES